MVLGDASGMVWVFDLRRPVHALSRHQVHADVIRQLAFCSHAGALSC